MSGYGNIGPGLGGCLFILALFGALAIGLWEAACWAWPFVRAWLHAVTA